MLGSPAVNAILFPIWSKASFLGFAG